MSNWTRRQILGSAAGVATLALSPLSRLSLRAEEGAKKVEKSPPTNKLPPLPYAYDALAPTISEKTMKFHHDVHHQAYVNNTIKLLSDHADLLALPVDELLANITKVPEKIRRGVINNAGGHSNHSIFWTIMGGKGGEPEGDLGKAIAAEFGNFPDFKKKFSTAAITQFGSGWAWLVLDKGKLAVVQRPNQDSPILDGQVPLLGLDVWEHAYYVDYGPKRPAYVEKWWDVVNWPAVAQRYVAAKA